MKKDTVIKNISKTFVALCDYADFRPPTKPAELAKAENAKPDETEQAAEANVQSGMSPNKMDLKSLQYHINIVLPDTRDQAVYDAIFKSLRDHLG